MALGALSKENSPDEKIWPNEELVAQVCVVTVQQDHWEVGLS